MIDCVIVTWMGKIQFAAVGWWFILFIHPDLCRILSILSMFLKKGGSVLVSLIFQLQGVDDETKAVAFQLCLFAISLALPVSPAATY